MILNNDSGHAWSFQGSILNAYAADLSSVVDHAFQYNLSFVHSNIMLLYFLSIAT